MTNQEFKCWINGYLTLSNDGFIDDSQVKIIRNHANLVEAVSGNLDESIRSFVAQLENEMMKQSNIAMTNMIVFFKTAIIKEDIHENYLR